MHSLAILLFAQLAFSLPAKRSEHNQSPWSSNFKRYCPGHGSGGDGYSGQILDNGLKYLLPVTIGSQTLEIEIDTGSSDTWFIQTGFECWDNYDRTNAIFTGPEDEAHCNFGPTYTPGSEFTPAGFDQLSCYGQSGENSLRCVGGDFGTADIDINGLTIPQQVVGAPLNSSFPAQGKPVQSGLLGLAFPSITSGVDASGAPVPYNSIIDTAFEVDDLGIQKKFSIALSRDDSANDNGGILTIGGIPDLTDPAVNASSDYTSAAWQFVASQSTTVFTFYSILVDNFVVGTESSNPDFQIVIDSGADVVELPEDLANAVNALWSPAISSDGTLDCNAVLTQPLGITIGGKTYYISSRDLNLVGSDGTCQSAIATGSEGVFLVGDPFLKNVLAVFDWEGQQLSFYERMYYES